MIQSDPLEKDGLYTGETWVHPDQYHASPRLSRSDLVALLRSPAHYRASKERPMVATPAMIRGDAVHTAILEPERFELEYILAPSDINRKYKAGKAAWAALLEEANGRKVVAPIDSGTVEAVSSIVREDRNLAAIFQGEGMTEPTACWTTHDGIGLRCRPDRVFLQPDGTPTVLDLKTSTDGSERAFMSEIAKRKLHVQAAFYIDGMTAASGDKYRTFMFLVMEMTYPYVRWAYELDELSIEQGRLEYQAALSEYRRCTKSGDWGGSSTEIRSIGLPGYAIQ